MPREPIDPHIRFMAKVDQNGPLHPDLGTRCWDWTRSTRKGYSQFMDGDGRIVGGHKWSLERRIGRKLRPDEVARHLCDRRICVNPDHLEPGTYEQNSADTTARGRTGKRTGGRREPLPDALVLDLRRRYADGASQGALAIRYGVAESTVRNIATGKRRKDVGGPITHRVAGDVEAGLRASLTAEQARAMRVLYADYGLTIRQVAERFTASVTHTTNIIAGRYWLDAGGPIGITRRPQTTPTRKAS